MHNDAGDAEITYICQMRREVGIQMNLLDAILDNIEGVVRDKLQEDAMRNA